MSLEIGAMQPALGIDKSSMGGRAVGGCGPSGRGRPSHWWRRRGASIPTMARAGAGELGPCHGMTGRGRPSTDKREGNHAHTSGVGHGKAAASVRESRPGRATTPSTEAQLGGGHCADNKGCLGRAAAPMRQARVGRLLRQRATMDVPKVEERNRGMKLDGLYGSNNSPASRRSLSFKPNKK